MCVGDSLDCTAHCKGTRVLHGRVGQGAGAWCARRRAAALRLAGPSQSVTRQSPAFMPETHLHTHAGPPQTHQTSHFPSTWLARIRIGYVFFFQVGTQASFMGVFVYLGALSDFVEFLPHVNFTCRLQEILIQLQGKVLKRNIGLGRDSEQ